MSRSSPGRWPYASIAISFLPILTLLVFIPVGAEDPATPQQGTEAAPAVEVVPPQIILKTQEPPVYPPAALAGRFSGAVTLSLVVLEDGEVDDVKIVDCSQKNLGFEQAATDAVKKWRFEPAQLEGEPVEFTLRFRMNFRGTGRGEPHVSAAAFSDMAPDAGTSSAPAPK